MGKTKYNNRAVNFVKLFTITTITAIIVTTILLVISAVLLEKLGLNEGQLGYIIYAVYLLTAISAGIMAGKIQKEKKFMWGALAGIVWFIMVFILSMCLNKEGIDTTDLFPAVVCMIGGGMLGGMLA